MVSYLYGAVPEALWPFVFLAVFLIVGGGALYLTPRIARWVDENRKNQPGYYDGMLERDPGEAERDGNEKEA